MNRTRLVRRRCDRTRCRDLRRHCRYLLFRRSREARRDSVRTYRTNDTATADARPLVLFIGDSYTAGKSSAELSYGCRAAVQMGWLCALSAVGGTGYISGGPANRWVDPHIGKSLSFSERIPHLSAKYDPAVVVLDGGRNDDFAAARVRVRRNGLDHRGGTPHLARGDRSSSYDQGFSRNLAMIWDSTTTSWRAWSLNRPPKA